MIDRLSSLLLFPQCAPSAAAASPDGSVGSDGADAHPMDAFAVARCQVVHLYQWLNPSFLESTFSPFTNWFVNSCAQASFAQWPVHEVVVAVAAVTLLTAWIVRLVTSSLRRAIEGPTPYEIYSLRRRFVNALWRVIRTLPFVNGFVLKELGSTLKKLEEDVHKDGKNVTPFRELPAEGFSDTEILNRLSSLQKLGHKDWRGGKISGTVYVRGDNLDEYTSMLTKAYGMFAWTNPLHPAVFPGVRIMEAEVISMCVKILHGSEKACGLMTCGGTESILMAMKAYRERGRIERRIDNPEVIVPESAHAAFDKACEYFGLRLRRVPVDKVTRKASVRHIARAVNSNTVCIVASCPSFPHGVIDPIEEIAAIARRANVGLHVDCCLGSFVVAHAENAGYALPLFDFRVPGVTSISIDTHKYGFAPKGSSVLTYATHELRRFQYSVFPDWVGGVYATPSITGSRPGALVAATWAALMHHGTAGYIQSTRKIIETARFIRQGIEEIPELFIYGDPLVSVVAFGSNLFDINCLVEPLVSKRNWDVNVLQFPASIHICVTMIHTAEDIREQFVADVRAAVADVMASPIKKVGGAGAIYGMAASIPDRTIIGDVARGYIDAVYKA